ncbi:unnamed protein product [Protopolystoma xenopodis]|uniref:Ferritin-like diiron domain-containing protein n=1 Tax=Protopolystoma xenopodis TaxID=117903 RepID=A0A3S5B071_9PLAT|nr:unnamed protein product [Protopolystoma xenopodis]
MESTDEEPKSNSSRENKPCYLLHSDLSAGLRSHITEELEGQLIYLSMASHFDRGDVNMPGLAAYFRYLADEKLSAADQVRLGQT